MIRVPGTVCNVVRKRCHDVCTGYSMQCGQERVHRSGLFSSACGVVDRWNDVSSCTPLAL
jgi:hypothetical protein